MNVGGGWVIRRPGSLEPPTGSEAGNLSSGWWPGAPIVRVGGQVNISAPGLLRPSVPPSTGGNASAELGAYDFSAEAEAAVIAGGSLGSVLLLFFFLAVGVALSEYNFCDILFPSYSFIFCFMGLSPLFFLAPLFGRKFFTFGSSVSPVCFQRDGSSVVVVGAATWSWSGMPSRGNSARSGRDWPTSATAAWRARRTRGCRRWLRVSFSSDSIGTSRLVNGSLNLDRLLFRTELCFIGT